MNWLFEQPLIIVVLGVLLCVGLGAAWSASGRKELIYAMATVLGLMLAGLVVERLVLTDREAIHATLREIARDVKSNNRRAVLRHLHSSVPDLKKKAEAEMPRYQFTECRVTKIHTTEIDAHTEPRSAIVEFNVIASGTFKAEGFEVTDTIPRWVQLHMLREKDGRWTIVDYKHDSPERMIFERPADGSPR
jgi:hypothetical protein